ncbi:beta-lactamase family protein [Lactobacillus johnsonii]|uniref:serine hydrolase domain-containing protein n=1 Tax=Lactobacillus johnsonii TaxID=33959 RepID=UPI001EB54773|nr:serine hydrolase domain-containing protein [Lactobacillus johnsonii]MBZ4028219.1 beta-lactamase family protein [Lactobacillus johnsonii]
MAIKNNKVILNESTGYANISKKEHNTPKTAFFINSVNKVFTGALVMKQVEQKKLKLNDKLSKFYPQVPHANQITIGQLLTMEAGLQGKDESSYGTPVFKNNQAGIKYDIKHNIVFNKKQYNQRFYSSSNYILLSGILEKVTHHSYESLVKETYIKKLGLSETEFYWDIPKNKRIKVAVSYTKNSQGYLVPHSVAVDKVHGDLGAGSLVMSNKDLYRATSAILNGEIIKPSSIQTVYAPSAPAKYNAGFYNFPDFHSSNGSGDGYTTYYRISNDTRDVLVVQSNYPVKDYFKVREICNDLMENLIKSPS